MGQFLKINAVPQKRSCERHIKIDVLTTSKFNCSLFNRYYKTFFGLFYLPKRFEYHIATFNPKIQNSIIVIYF